MIALTLLIAWIATNLAILAWKWWQDREGLKAATTAALQRSRAAGWRGMA